MLGIDLGGAMGGRIVAATVEGAREAGGGARFDVGRPIRGTTEVTTLEEAPALRQRLLQPRMLLGLVAVVIALVVVTRAGLGLDWREVWTLSRQANPWLLTLAFVVFYTTFPVRALRWRVLLGNVGYRREAGRAMPSLAGLTEMLYRSWFVNCVTVARLGDVYRGYLLKRAAGVSAAVTLGTVVTERLVDLGVLAAMVAVATPVAFHGQIPREAWEAAAVGLGVVVIAIAALVSLSRFRALVERVVPERFHDGYRRLIGGVAGSFRRVPALIGYSAAGWVIEGTTLYLVAAAVGAPVSVAGAVVAALVGSLLTVIPITPSGLGLTEAGMIILLGRLGLDAGSAAAVTLLVRVINYWSIVVLGSVIYVVRRRA